MVHIIDELDPTSKYVCEAERHYPKKKRKFKTYDNPWEELNKRFNNERTRTPNISS